MVREVRAGVVAETFFSPIRRTRLPASIFACIVCLSRTRAETIHGDNRGANNGEDGTKHGGGTVAEKGSGGPAPVQ
jgi:hypothetical protein